jgi:hypothetical protein
MKTIAAWLLHQDIWFNETKFSAPESFAPKQPVKIQTINDKQRTANILLNKV